MRKRLNFGDFADFGGTLMFQRSFPLCFGGFSLCVPRTETGGVPGGSLQVQLQLTGV